MSISINGEGEVTSKLQKTNSFHLSIKTYVDEEGRKTKVVKNPIYQNSTLISRNQVPVRQFESREREASATHHFRSHASNLPAVRSTTANSLLHTVPRNSHNSIKFPPLFRKKH